MLSLSYLSTIFWLFVGVPDFVRARVFMHPRAGSASTFSSFEEIARWSLTSMSIQFNSVQNAFPYACKRYHVKIKALIRHSATVVKENLYPCCEYRGTSESQNSHLIGYLVCTRLFDRQNTHTRRVVRHAKTKEKTIDEHLLLGNIVSSFVLL